MTLNFAGTTRHDLTVVDAAGVELLNVTPATSAPITVGPTTVGPDSRPSGGRSSTDETIKGEPFVHV